MVVVSVVAANQRRWASANDGGEATATEGRWTSGYVSGRRLRSRRQTPDFGTTNDIAVLSNTTSVPFATRGTGDGLAPVLVFVALLARVSTVGIRHKDLPTQGRQQPNRPWRLDTAAAAGGTVVARLGIVLIVIVPAFRIAPNRSETSTRQWIRDDTTPE